MRGSNIVIENNPTGRETDFFSKTERSVHGQIRSIETVFIKTQVIIFNNPLNRQYNMVVSLDKDDIRQSITGRDVKSVWDMRKW